MHQIPEILHGSKSMEFRYKQRCDFTMVFGIDKPIFILVQSLPLIASMHHPQHFDQSHHPHRTQVALNTK